MSDLKNVNGHIYPAFDDRWGGFAEELFHYTSRYYVATEAFLRNLSQDPGFAMGGYRHDLAGHLDSPSSALRTSLLNAVLRLHAAGYVLRNHPHLTHAQAQEIGDLDSV